MPSSSTMSFDVVVAPDERRRHDGWAEPIVDRPVSDGVPVARRGAASLQVRPARPRGAAWMVRARPRPVHPQPAGRRAALRRSRWAPASASISTAHPPSRSGSTVTRASAAATASSTPTGAEQCGGVGFPCRRCVVPPGGGPRRGRARRRRGRRTPAPSTGRGRRRAGRRRRRGRHALGGVDECFEPFGVEGAGWYRRARSRRRGSQAPVRAGPAGATRRSAAWTRPWAVRQSTPQRLDEGVDPDHRRRERRAGRRAPCAGWGCRSGRRGRRSSTSSTAPSTR